jgi:hypothetical protein
LEGFSRYWFEVLTSGGLTGRPDHCDEWIKAVFIPTTQLVSNYTNLDKKAEWYRTVQQNELIGEFKRLCPSVRYDRQQDRHLGQRRGWWLPDLVTARREFERFIGGPVDWSVDVGAAVGFDAATLDAHWAGREPTKRSLSDILDEWDKE